MKLPFLSACDASPWYSFSLITVAEIGRYDDDNALAQVRMSGSMPKVSQPNMLPVRPKPQITSSAMNSTS